MIQHLFALLERLTPRLVSAGLVFLFAAVSTPSVVGVYSFGVLLYTAIQSITETSIRQLLPQLVATRSPFLAQYRIAASLGGGTGMFLGIGLIFSFTNGETGGIALALLPMVLAPAANAVGLEAVGRLQLGGQWSRLAQTQLIGALLSLVLTIPVLVITRSPVAMALQLFLGELIAAACARTFARGLGTKLVEQQASQEGSVRTQYFSLAGYSILSWSQGQLDRVFLGALAGSAKLGTFSVASALARSIGDPLAASTANLLRSRLQAGKLNANEIRRHARQIIGRGVLLGAAAAVVSTAAAVLIFGPLLGPKWTAAVAILPILALTCVPAAANWSASVLQVALGQVRRAVLSPIVGLTFAPLTAVLALTDLRLAAWSVVLRELAIMTVGFWLARRVAPWRTYALALLLVVAGGVAGALVSG